MKQATTPRLTPTVHLTGCPSQRTEGYEALRPSGEEIGIVRCIDCGASEVWEHRRFKRAQMEEQKRLQALSIEEE